MFVGLSFPRAPVTLLIIIRYLESPATTFGLVNHIRLSHHLRYEFRPLNGRIPQFSLTYRELLIFSRSPSGASSIFPESHSAAIFGSNGR